MSKNDEDELKYLLEEIARIENQLKFLDNKENAENMFLRK